MLKKILSNRHKVKEGGIKVKEVNWGKLVSYPLCTVPSKSPHRQLKHQPAGSPGRHRSLNHHSTLQSARVCGCESMCVRVWSGCPRCPVQPDSRSSRELARGGVRGKEECVVSVAVEVPHGSYVPLSASVSLCVKRLPILLHTVTLRSAAHEVNECVRVYGRERECALSLLSSPLSSFGSFPSLPHILTSFSQGLNQVTGLMWRYSSY